MSATPPTAVAHRSKAAPAGDALAPFEDALRGRFPSREELLAEARAQTAAQRARGRRSARRGAGALLAVAVALLWWADPAWQREEVRTAAGEQATWSLADGSTITLNTGSVLEVQTRLRSRRLALRQGEAAFHVVHGWRPFEVQAGAVVVRDIGTAFGVRRLTDAADSGARVTVYEGAVEVRSSSGSNGQTDGAPLVLRAGQAATAGAGGGAPAVRQVDPATAGAWRQGRLVFDGTPLAEVVAELQRYRSAPIVLAAPQGGGVGGGDGRGVGALRLSGEYDAKGIEALIDALPQALPVAVQRHADGSVHIAAQAKKH